MHAQKADYALALAIIGRRIKFTTTMISEATGSTSSRQADPAAGDHDANGRRRALRESVARQPCRVVLLDIWLPGMDVLTRIREMPREDLFYRLNVTPFCVPPLRQRSEDVPLLAEHFLKEITCAYGRKPKNLTPEAVAVLKEYAWPGNVRKLRNLMEHIVILCSQVSNDARHIPLNAARSRPNGSI